MVYVPNVWQDGDEITVKKLNHMEYGISSQTLFIGVINYDAVNNNLVLENSTDDIVNAVNNQNLTFLLIKRENSVELYRIYTAHIDENNQKLVINNDMTIGLNDKVVDRGVVDELQSNSI